MRKIARLAAIGVLAGPSALATAKDKVGEIWDTQKINRRVEARSYTYLGFGPNELGNLGTDGSGQSLSAAYLWETTPYAAIRAGIDFSMKTGDVDAAMTSGSLGAQFYLTPTAFSPYLGVDFGYGGAVSDADGIDNVGNWSLGAGLGVALFRTSSVQMHLSARYVQILEDNGKGRPHSRTLSLGVAF